MKRKIEFRGLNQHQEWLYGSLVTGLFYNINTQTEVCNILDTSEHSDFDCFQDLDDMSTDVITETVGQFTGFKDKNGKKIYEGDIISMSTGKPVAVIEYDYCGFVLKWIDEIYLTVKQTEKEPVFRNIHLFEVVGNIHENPELL